jgi:molybdopterin synthase sulfur carrier subunit
MAKLIFTQQLRRFTEVPEILTAATNLRAALDDAYRANPRLRGYIQDEQGHVRQHVAIFIDGLRIHDRAQLSDAISANSTVHVLQALSGG